MSKATDYYLDMEAMKKNVATVNTPPVEDIEYVRNVQKWKRYRPYVEDIMELQLRLVKYIKELKEKELMEALLTQGDDERPTPFPRRLDDPGQNTLRVCPPLLTLDGETLIPPYTADEFAYESTLSSTRQLQALENQSTPSLNPGYSQVSSGGTHLSMSRDISPPAHLLPSDLFVDSPPPQMISEAMTQSQRQRNLSVSCSSPLTYEDLCQDLEPVDESTLKKAFDIFNLASNIKKYREKYKAIELPTVPLQEISPVVEQESKNPDEKHYDELPFKLLEEIFECTEGTQVKDNQYLTPLTLNLESNLYTHNQVELTPLNLESNQYDIRNNQVQQNTYIAPMTPSLNLERNLAIVRDRTPLQVTPRPQTSFTSLNINVNSVQSPIQETQLYQYPSINFTSAQLLPYEIFCEEFDTQPTNDTSEYEHSNLQATARYFARDIDDPNQSHVDLPHNIKTDDKIMNDSIHSTDQSVEGRKWSLLPYWTCDKVDYEAKAADEPVDEISFKEIEDEFNTLTISNETIEILESLPDLDDIIDWASISPIWSYKKEDKAIIDNNQQYKEPNESLSLPGHKEDEAQKSEIQNEPNSEFQFLLIPSDNVKDSKEKTRMRHDVVEHIDRKENFSQRDVKTVGDSKDKTVHDQTSTKTLNQPINKPTVKNSESGVHAGANVSKITKDPIKIKANKNRNKTQEFENTDMSLDVSEDAMKQNEKNTNKYKKVSQIDKKLFNNPNRVEYKVDYKEKTRKAKEKELATKGRRKSKHMKNTKGRKSKKK